MLETHGFSSRKKMFNSVSTSGKKLKEWQQSNQLIVTRYSSASEIVLLTIVWWGLCVKLRCKSYLFCVEYYSIYLGNVVMVIVIGLQILHISWIKWLKTSTIFHLTSHDAHVPHDMCSMRAEDYCRIVTLA